MANRFPQNFYQSTSFLPERWLENKDRKFATDRKNAYEPFQVGLHACPGKRWVFPYKIKKFFLPPFTAFFTLIIIKIKNKKFTAFFCHDVELIKYCTYCMTTHGEQSRMGRNGRDTCKSTLCLRP